MKNVDVKKENTSPLPPTQDHQPTRHLLPTPNIDTVFDKTSYVCVHSP